MSGEQEEKTRLKHQLEDIWDRETVLKKTTIGIPGSDNLELAQKIHGKIKDLFREMRMALEDGRMEDVDRIDKRLVALAQMSGKLGS